MSCGPCGYPIVNGQPGGSGGARYSRLYAESIVIGTTNVAGALASVGSFTVTASSLINNGDMLHLVVGGDLLATTGRSISFGLAVGGVTFVAPAAGAIAGNAQRRPWSWSMNIVRITAATGRAYGEMWFQNSVTAPVAGFGSMSAAAIGGPVGSAVADTAIDWTVNQTFDIQVFQTVTAGGDDFTRRVFTVELWQAP